MLNLVLACLATSTLAMAALPANAAIVVHDFNDLAINDVASLTIGPVTYTAFGGPIASTGPSNTDGFFSSPNGTPGLVSFDLPTPSTPTYWSILATIAGGTSFASIELSSFGGPPVTWFLTAYDLDGVYLGHVYHDVDVGVTTLETLSFSAPNIGSVAFGVQGNFSVIADNFAFEVAGAGVPEPASWAMMIAGFGLIGVALRRRQSASLLPQSA